MTRRTRRISGFAKIPVREPFVLVGQHPQIVSAICLGVLSVIALCGALYVARAYLLPLAAALVFSVILAPICSRLEWFRLPRMVAAVMALALAAGVAWLAFTLIAQPANRWISNAPAVMDRAERQFKKLQAPLKPLTDISREVQDISIVPPDGAPKPRTVVVEGPELTQSLLASVQVIAVQLGFVLLLTFLLLITREEFREKLIAFQPTLPDRVRTARAFRDMEKRVSGYFVTFSIINIVLGVATGLACWHLGLPEPAMWGGLAAVFNFIPFLGPVVMMALLGIAGLATYNDLLDASFPMLAFIGISFLEANLITPTIVGRRMTLNPLAIVLAVSFWIWIWGPAGGVIALPLLIMFKVVCDHTPALRVVGALIGAPLLRPKPDEAPASPPPAPPQSFPEISATFAE